MRLDYVILILLISAVGIFLAIYLVRRLSKDKSDGDEIKNLLLDIRLFQAYNEKYEMSYLILYAMAYILENKMTQNTALENIRLLSRSEKAPSVRNQDLCNVIIKSVSEPDRRLLDKMIEKQLTKYAMLDNRVYENAMINIVMNLGRIEEATTNDE